MFKSIAAALVLVLASSGAGLADDAAPQATSGEALKSDPHVAKALEFIAVSGSKDLMLQQMDLMVDGMMEQLRKTKPDVPGPVWDLMRTTIKDEFRTDSDDLLFASARIYSNHFSDAELDQLVAFYKSDVGIKLLHERPQIVRESAAVGEAWAMRMQPVIMDKLIKKLQAMGPMTKEQKS